MNMIVFFKILFFFWARLGVNFRENPRSVLIYITPISNGFLKLFILQAWIYIWPPLKTYVKLGPTFRSQPNYCGQRTASGYIMTTTFESKSRVQTYTWHKFITLHLSMICDFELLLYNSTLIEVHIFILFFVFFSRIIISVITFVLQF